VSLAHGEPSLATPSTKDRPAVPASTRAADAPLLAVCVLGIVFLLVQIVTFRHGRDQGIYTMVARITLEGGMPYRDAWDFKPPGIFLIYAVSRLLFGAAPWGIRALEVAGLAAMCVGLMRLAQAWWGEWRVGLVGATLAILVHAQLDFWHTSQPESFGGMITVAALLLAPRPGKDGLTHPDPTPLRNWLAAGALYGFSFLLKPPLVGGAAVALMLPMWAAYKAAQTEERGIEKALLSAVRAALRPALALAAGGALPLAACVAWFAAKGALHDLYQVLFVFTPHYTALGWEGSSVMGMLYWGFTEWLQNYCSVVTVGLLILLGLGAAPREKPLCALLLGVIAIHLVGVAMQGKFFPYHYGATWPVTALLAGLGIWKVWERLGRRSALGGAVFFFGLTAVLFCRTACKDVPGSFLERCGKRLALLAGGMRDQRGIDELASIADVNSVADRAAAEMMRAHVPPDRPVFVWGFEPVIYDMADRRPATRYLYNVPQRVAWAKADARRVLMEDLAKNPPAAIVVEHWDVFPFVTGDAIDSADSLRDFPALRDLIDERYEHLSRVGGLDVYLERQ
jgi:hypothetical protein